MLHAHGHRGGVVPLRARSHLHAPRPAEEADRAGPRGLRAAPPERPGDSPAAPVLPHREGRHRSRRSHQGPESHAAGLPGVEAVVPAASRASGRRGRALPRCSHGRRRRPAPRPGARGPLPQRPLRHADHADRRPHHRRDPPRTGSAHIQASATDCGASRGWTAATRPSSPWF